MALGNNNVSAIRTLLQQLVTGYQAGGDVVDWVHMERAKSA
jgi:hypothetical protein